MQTVLTQMENCPHERMRPLLESIGGQQFQRWIDAPEFWDELNQELDRRGQVLMTLLPSDSQGHC